MLYAYLGSAEETDSFTWEYKSSPETNLPKKLSPELLDTHNLFHHYISNKNSNLKFQKADWGRYAAKVDKQFISDFLKKENLNTKEFNDFLNSLKEDTDYSFVIAELY